MTKSIALGLTIAALAALAAAPAVWADARLSGAVNARQLYKNDAANATVTLVSADDARVTRVFGLMLSVDSSDTLTLKCGGQTRAAFFLSARSGLAQPLYPLSLDCRARSANLVGTVATSAGSATITGTGTTFTQSFAPGDRVVITGGDVLTIQSVGGDTSMTASATAASTVSGAAFQRGADALTLTKGVATTAVHASLWYEQER